MSVSNTSESLSQAFQANSPQDFETALAQLEHLVNQLENGGLPLEDALTVFEQGIHLTRHCQQRLANAEQKVQQLMATQEGIQLQEFPPHSQM